MKLEDPAATLALGEHLQVREKQNEIEERENTSRKNMLKDKKLK